MAHSTPGTRVFCSRRSTIIWSIIRFLADPSGSALDVYDVPDALVVHAPTSLDPVFFLGIFLVSKPKANADFYSIARANKKALGRECDVSFQ
jgi:hypothetical protein